MENPMLCNKIKLIILNEKSKHRSGAVAPGGRCRRKAIRSAARGLWAELPLPEGVDPVARRTGGCRSGAPPPPHALFKWHPQQEPGFKVGLLRRKTAVLLTAPPPAKIPLPPKPSSPIFNHPSLRALSVYLTRSLFPHPL